MKKMSIKVDLIELLESQVESLIDIEVSNSECLRILMQNLNENIEAGAPSMLIHDIYNEMIEGFDRIGEIYLEYVKTLGK